MENAGTKIVSDSEVRIVIPICPCTKKNSQNIFYKNMPDGRKTPFVAPSSKYREYLKGAAIFLKPLEIDSPVNVKAVFYMNTRRRVDLTNLNEALHDAMVACGVIVDDNAGIIVSTDGSCVRYDKKNPRTEVVITDAEPTFV